MPWKCWPPITLAEIPLCRRKRTVMARGLIAGSTTAASLATLDNGDICCPYSTCRLVTGCCRFLRSRCSAAGHNCLFALRLVLASGHSPMPVRCVVRDEIYLYQSRAAVAATALFPVAKSALDRLADSAWQMHHLRSHIGSGTCLWKS